MRRGSFQLGLLIVGGLLSSVSYSQNVRPATISQDNFPYAFGNFAWWSNTDLRADLKKRLPTLGEEIARHSPIESRVRAVLIQLLKEKGIEAEVLVMEPSMDVLSSKRVPGAPPPSIVYSVLSPPEILVEKLVFENAPDDASGQMNEVAVRVQGKTYSEMTFWSDEQSITDSLQQLGYLSSAVTMDHGTPRKDGDHYLVPITAVITAGPKYHVASIKADGGPLVQGRDLSSYFAIKPGDVATPYAFGRLAGALRSVYWHAGYVDVDFVGPPVLDPAHALASYQLQVIPGPVYRLRSMKFENLDSVQETKARDMLGLRTGEVYDAMAVSDLSRKISDLRSPLFGYGFSYSPKEDKTSRVIDLTLTFYKQPHP
jgi:hypothetical protein